MMEAVRTSEKSVDNHFTRQYIPEDNSEQNAEMVPKFQVATACFSCNPPNFKLIKNYPPLWMPPI
jgi:hypothetical protein